MSLSYIIFSDLDATLLDHQTYDFSAAKPALSFIKKNHIIDLEGMKVGLIHNLGVPQLTIKNVFNGNVDIIVYGDTHIAELKEFKGIMLINPGSPTFPNSGERRPGTIAILEIANEKADVSIIQLS